MSEKLDFKKVEKAYYQPPTKPHIIEIPPMIFIKVEGQGDPNKAPAYQEAVQMLYGLSFTIKMSKEKPQGHFDYTVPPLEGLWSLGRAEFPQAQFTSGDKRGFIWKSIMRQPDFVTEEVFQKAREALAKKRPELDLNKAELWHFTEGLVVQMMHIGPYDSELPSLQAMHAFAEAEGYAVDFSETRWHHEIYLGDPRKTDPAKLKTVLRHPVRKR